MVSGILDKVISHAYQESRQVNFSELVDQLFKSLNSREIEVLKERYGLFAGQPSTLELIGQRHHITRERVRQIERGAIAKVKANKNFELLVRGFRMSLVQSLTNKGGLASEEEIVKEFFDGDDNSRNMLLFLLKLFEPDYLEEVKLPNAKKAWMIKNADLVRYQDFITEIKKILTEVNHPVSLAKIIALFKATDYYRRNENNLNLGLLNTLNEEALKEDKDNVLGAIISSYINISREITTNPFNEIGLSGWRSVVPKRMCEKIYLILKHAGSPMHFRDITQAINDAGFDKKVAHTPTIHNELILDKRFVLIGRGIYALKDWGYSSGVVADIIEAILQQSGSALSKKEIFEAVKKQRIVKDGTIYLALNNKDRFAKNEEGKYSLKEKIDANQPEEPSIIKDLDNQPAKEIL